MRMVLISAGGILLSVATPDTPAKLSPHKGAKSNITRTIKV